MKKYQYKNSKKTLEYSEIALSNSKNTKWNKCISQSFLMVGSSQYALLDNTKALQSYNEALKFTSHQKTKAALLQAMVLLHSSQSNYTKSIEFYFETLKISEPTNDKPLNTKIYTNIVTDYYRMRKYQKTEEYCQKALKIHEELHNNKGISLICQNLGNLYYTNNHSN